MQGRFNRAAGFKQLATASAGFTLLELVVVLVMVGILVAIAAPSWFGFLSTRQLSAAQERVHQVMRDAQSTAKLRHVNWQASFRETGGQLQWATHAATTLPADAIWNDLDANVQIDIAETTLYQTNGVRRVQFDRRGALTAYGNLGRITLNSKNGGRVKRCVIVSTLLGATRKGQDQPTAQSGKYCR